MTKEYTTLLKKRRKKKQLQTHHLPTDDVDNPNSINYGGDIRFVNKHRSLPRGTE